MCFYKTDYFNSILFLGTCVFVWIPSLPQYFKGAFIIYLEGGL